MTALELEIRVHWREMDKEAGPWDGLRIRRLCDILGLTLSEFSALIRIPKAKLLKWAMDGKYPGSVKNTLNLIERAAHQNYLGKAYTSPLFPLGL